IFKFRPGSLPRTRTRFVDELIADGSGKRLRIAGRAILQVTFEPARAHTAQGAPTAAPRRRPFNLPHVLTGVRSGDFECQVNHGQAMDERARGPGRPAPGGHRIVVGVRAAFPPVSRQGYYPDRDAFFSGGEPYFAPVRRRELAAEPATAELDRLFAGATPRKF